LRISKPTKEMPAVNNKGGATAQKGSGAQSKSPVKQGGQAAAAKKAEPAKVETPEELAARQAA